MTGQPLVSIITPSHNHAAFLEETIRSVLAQDYPNIEYIVVDGGSTDGSVEIIKRYGDRIARWVSEPDEGQSHAINKGFRMATGEIVAWLNSDDLYFPDAVSTAVKCFVADERLGLVYGHGVFVDRDGGFLRYFTEVEPYDAFRLRNCSDYIMQPTTFFRRDALLDVGLLNESLHYAMDWDLWCRFAESGCGVHFEPRLIAATRVYPETKTTAGSRPRLNEIFRTLRRHATGWWPHAYFGFRATELRSTLERRDLSLLQRARLSMRLFLLRLANWRNILYDRHRSNDLYGLRRRTNELMPHARLCWPVYKDCDGVTLQLRSRRERKVVICTAHGGNLETTLLPGKNAHVQVELPRAVTPTPVIDLLCAVERAGRGSTTVVIEEARLI
ncbi:MAG: glycosyltransferase [Verrucomicrobia bacterium]|nr:glycosyltransferase [Verrucomicrobiota bacterium]